MDCKVPTARFHRQADDESVDPFTARCKIQTQKCRFSEAKLEERIIEQLIIGTHERKIQEVLLGKDDKLKLDKAMDIARTREDAVIDMKSLEQRGASASARSHDTNIDAIRQNSTSDVENVVSAMKKSAQLKVEGAESLTSGTTGNKCAEINKHRTRKPSLHFGSSLGVGYHRPRQVRTRYTQLKRQIQTLMSCVLRQFRLTVPMLLQ